MSAPTDPTPGSRDRVPGSRRSSVRSSLEPTSPRPGNRLALVGRLGLVVVLLLAVVATVVVVSQRNQFGRQDAGAEEIPALEVAPAPVQLGTVAQPDALAPPTSLVPGGAPSQAPGGGARTVSGWATDIASRVDVPARALQAYGQADLAVKQEQPDCNLSWVTVAGLARIESNHGRYRGAAIADNGDVTPRVVGVPLDGTGGNRTIGDTDRGVLDGDA